MAIEQERATESVEYIATMLGQLHVMARDLRYDMLAYLIDMAQLQARKQMAMNARQLSADKRDSPT